jgi:hypothetical protein
MLAVSPLSVVDELSVFDIAFRILSSQGQVSILDRLIANKLPVVGFFINYRLWINDFVVSGLVVKGFDLKTLDDLSHPCVNDRS